jgi:hypothetical protein
MQSSCASGSGDRWSVLLTFKNLTASPTPILAVVPEVFRQFDQSDLLQSLFRRNDVQMGVLSYRGHPFQRWRRRHLPTHEDKALEKDLCSISFRVVLDTQTGDLSVDMVINPLVCRKRSFSLNSARMCLNDGLNG